MKFFLDIDGVMVHANPHKSVELEDDGFYRFNQIAVAVLNAVTDPDDELILSTSHRFRFSVEKWTDIFQKRKIHAKKISVLDIPVQQTSNRKSEILAWIDQCNLPSEEIIIIDDDKSLNDLPGFLKERLVLTNSYTGLNSSFNLDRIIELTKRQLS